MCFSPEADFTAGVVVAGVGVEALRRVRAPRELIVGALPLLFGLHLLEPDRRRARALWPLAGLGVFLGVYLLWQVTAYPVGAHQAARCIIYTTHIPNDVLVTLLYVLVTCGPALASSRQYLRWFGAVSLVGVIGTALVRADGLTSLWCLNAAGLSVVILEHSRRQRAVETRASAVRSPVVPS